MSNRCEYVVKLGINLLIMNILSTETWISYVYKWIILKTNFMYYNFWEIIYKDEFKMNKV